MSGELNDSDARIPSPAPLVGGWADPLDQKLIDAFPGKVVRKDLVQKLKVGFSIPVYVLEYLLGKYCSTTDEAQLSQGLELVKKAVKDRLIQPDQGELLKSRLERDGSKKIIDLVTVNFDEKDQGGKYWAKLNVSGLDKVHIDEKAVYANERVLTGGVWANIELEYDGTRVHGGVTRPFVLKRVNPIQIATARLPEFRQARATFTREEWVNVLLRTMGYEPTALAMTWRRKLLYLLRLVPLVEKNFNLIELGPKETGKSFVYRELSPYSNLLSGGQGSVPDLFGWKNRRDKPGLVIRYDVVAFDEVAGENFKSAQDKDMFKGYMEQGSFSRGDDKGVISAMAGIVFNGNIDGDVAKLLRTSHLFSALPEQIRDDDAFHDRWHAYLPGWDVLKLSAELFTSHLGFIADYIAEIFHNELRPLNYTDACERWFAMGKHLGQRDRRAVLRTVSGLVKLIHPDESYTKEDLREYLAFAMEMRRRVKEQLKRIRPSEFPNTELSYLDRESGQEFVAECPELHETGTVDGAAIVRPLRSPGAPVSTPGEVYEGYELLQQLTSGGMAEAYMAKEVASGETVFLKRVRKAAREAKALQRELAIYDKLMRLNCEHVIRIRAIPQNDTFVALVADFADGGDLEAFVRAQNEGGGLPVSSAKEIALNIAQALAELHANSIVHRDLKPNNVLSSNGRWKLADFGIAKNLSQLMTTNTFQQAGTYGYAPKEQFDGVEAHSSADVYAFGKVAVFLLTGQTDPDFVTYPAWRHLIFRCLSPEPSQRPVIQGVIEELTLIPV
jgi:ATP-dependent Lon protease